MRRAPAAVPPRKSGNESEAPRVALWLQRGSDRYSAQGKSKKAGSCDAQRDLNKNILRSRKRSGPGGSERQRGLSRRENERWRVQTAGFRAPGSKGSGQGGWGVVCSMLGSRKDGRGGIQKRADVEDRETMCITVRTRRGRPVRKRDGRWRKNK